MQEKEIQIPENYKYIAVFLSMRCNLNCSFCLNALDKSKEFDRFKFKELSGEEWIKALNRIRTKQEVPITFSGGEPFLHKDFTNIINNLKPELNIDILTNFYNNSLIEKFILEANPEKIKRDAPYPSIRVSYHPEQMRAEQIIENVKKAQDYGFSIGVYSVLYPSSEQLSAINQMQFKCKDAKIDFRVKEFTGKYKKDLYGDYSKYPNAVYSENLRSCLCKTSELLIGPNGNVYRCHRDLFEEENPIGNITDPDFQIKNEFRACSNYGHCHPCDTKVKTDYKQELGHTSVEIKDIE